jgi:transcriptional regulator with XRE-family HTH domain
MERIRQLRKERGLSQVKLAVMADMDPATLNRLERGTGNPNLKTLERVAEALGVEVADFFPKAARRSSLEPTLLNGLKEERRSPLSPWAEYARRMAARIRDHTDNPNSLAFRDTWAALFFVEEKNREAADLYFLLFEEEMGQEPYGDEPLAALEPALAAFEELAESLAEAQRRAEQMAEEVEESEIGQARRSAAASVAQRKQAAAQFNAGRERRGA